MEPLASTTGLSGKCTVCRAVTDDICQHILLKVVVCKTCLADIKSKSSVVGEVCIWCMQPGDLLPCVQCPYKCCYECINHNLGTDYMSCLNEKNWICFLCDPNPIESLRHEYVRLNDTLRRSIIDAAAPEGSSSSNDIPSPFVAIDDTSNETLRLKQQRIIKKHVAPNQDLDEILQTYERQIEASLELDDANVPAIIAEINSIETGQLSAAIVSFKKCLSAFASDLTNLESRVTQAVVTGNHGTLGKLTALLRILIQHHIFNRLAHPRARIRDDAKSDKRPCSPIIAHSGQPVQKKQPQMVFIMDPEWLTDPKKFRLTVEKVAMDLSKRTTIIGKYVPKYEIKKRLGAPLSPSSSSLSLKRHRSEELSLESRADRQRRSLTTPSWLSDFKVEKENDEMEADEDVLNCGEDDADDEEWCDYRLFRNPDMPRKRGRPPKNPNFVKPTPALSELVLVDGVQAPKRGRGRPRKLFTINDKQPRYYVPKLNGDALCRVDDEDPDDEVYNYINGIGDGD